MEISLSPEMESWIHQKVSSGLYQSESEVVREGLRLLLDREALRQERVTELRRELAIGLTQLKERLFKPFDSSMLEGIRSRGRERRDLE